MKILQFIKCYLRLLWNSFPSLDPPKRISCSLLSAKKISKLVLNLRFASKGLNSKLSCFSGMTCFIKEVSWLVSTKDLYLRTVFSYSRDFLSTSLVIRQISGNDCSSLMSYRGFGNLLWKFLTKYYFKSIEWSLIIKHSYHKTRFSFRMFGILCKHTWMDTFLAWLLSALNKSFLSALTRLKYDWYSLMAVSSIL